MTGALAEQIIVCLEEAGSGKSLSPQDVAKQIRPDDWRPLLSPVKQAALNLARQGGIEILRKGKPVDPFDTVKGVIRYRLKLD